MAIRAGAQGCPSNAPTSCPSYQQVTYFGGTQVVNPMVEYATVHVLIQTGTPLTQPTVVQSINDELDDIFYDALDTAGAELSRSFVTTSGYIPFSNSVLLTTPNQVVKFANDFAAGQYNSVQATIADPQFLYISGPTAQMCKYSTPQPPDMCTYTVPSAIPQDNNAEIAEVTVVNNQLLPASAGYNTVTDYPQSQLKNVLATEDSHSVLDVGDCTGANCSNTMANPTGNTHNVPTLCDLQEIAVLTAPSEGQYGCPPPQPPPPSPAPPNGGQPGLNGSSGGGGGSDGGGGGDSGGVYLLYTSTTTIDYSDDGGSNGYEIVQTTYYYSDGSISVGSPEYNTYGVCSTWGY
jgi:hypothetical protein